MFGGISADVQSRQLKRAALGHWCPYKYPDTEEIEVFITLLGKR